MHPTTFFPLLLLLLTTPHLTSATGTLGFALGTKLADGSCKYTSDYEADFDAISAASGSTLVRGYSASDCNAAQQILPAAQAKGFQVILGVWYVLLCLFLGSVAAGMFLWGFRADGCCWADEGRVGNTGLMLSRRLRRIPLPCKRTYLRTLTRCMPSRSARRLCTVAPSPATHSSRRSTKSKQCSLPSRLAPQIAGTNTPTAPRTL